MCLYLLDFLIDKKIINQVIDLQRVHPESSVLTHIYKIVGICENAKNIISSKIWQLFLK